MARKEKKRRKTAEKENREIELFADDLFRFMLTQRLCLQNPPFQIRRKPGEQVANFNLFIDIPLGVIGETLRSRYFRYFFHLNVLETHDLNSIVRYYSTYVELLAHVNECDIFDKLLVLASVTIEIAAFCFLRGNREIVHHAPNLYSCAFRQFKKDFFDSGGWSELYKLMLEESGFYTESKFKEIAANAQMNVKSEWTRRSARRLSVLNRTAISFAMKLHDNDTKYAFSAFMHHLNDLRDPKVECTQAIDCPEAKEWRLMADQIMLIFKLYISRKKDDRGYETLCSILDNDNHVSHLLRYCMFIKLINSLIVRDIYHRTYDIMHFVTQLLMDNPRVAYFCIDKMQDIYQIPKSKMSSQQHPEGMSSDEISKGFNLTETNSHATSCKLSSNKNDTASEHEAHKILLRRYLDEIAPKDKPYTSPRVPQILDILSNENNLSMLLNCKIFREIISMRLTLQNNHFGEAWTLQAMEIILEFLKPSKRSSTQVDNATKINNSNEVSKNFTDPKVTELKMNTVPTTVTETEQSSISYSQETIITKTVECNDQNVKNTQSSICSTSSHETANMEIAESIDLNMKSVDTLVSSTSSQEISKTKIEGSDLNMKSVDTQVSYTSSQEISKTKIEGSGLNIKVASVSSTPSHVTIISKTVEGDGLNMETIHAPVPTSSHEIGNTEIVGVNDLSMKFECRPGSSSSQETLTSETVEGVDLDMETSHALIPTSSRESVTTKIDEDDNLKVEKQTNIHKCTVCNLCLDRFKNGKKTVCTGQSIEIFIPLRKRKDIEDTSASQPIIAAPGETNRDRSEITHETSVHEQNLPALENPNSTEDYTILLEDLAISDSTDSS